MYTVLELSKERILTCTFEELGVFSVQLDVVDQKVKSVAGSIAERVHATAYLHQRQAITSMGEGDKANERALNDFLADMHVAKQAAIKESADGKVPSALDSAIRKLTLGLERGADLSVESTSNKVQSGNKSHNDEVEKAKEEAAFRETCIRNGIDPDAKGGVKGAVDGGKGTVELTGVELALAAILPKLDELNAIDPERVGDMIVGFESRVDKALSEIKAKVGERMVG